jgi:hypothetical protein
MIVNITKVPMQIKNAIVVHESVFFDMDVIPRRMILQIGSWRREVEVELSSDITKNVIALSNQMHVPFDFPENIPFDVTMTNRVIHVGPVIGLIAFREEREMDLHAIQKFKDYVVNYVNLRGLLYICAADSISFSNQTVKGYVYQPDQKSDQPSFQLSTFPLPDVFINKVRLDEPVVEQLISSHGEKLVNSYVWNYRELEEWLSSYPSISSHLLSMNQLTTLEKLDEMLNMHETVVLKPIHLRSNCMEYKVKKLKNRYQWINQWKVYSYSKDEATVLISKLIPEEPFLIQPLISSINKEGNSYILRAFLQKNRSKHWRCSAIVSDFKGAEEFSLTGQEILRNAFHLNEREVFLKEQEIITLCHSVCQLIEKCYGTYADLCVTMKIDEDLNLWLLDIDPLYEHQMLSESIQDQQTYFNIVTTPLEYAKSLSGFL